jgi:hypothetical protein
VQAIASKEIGGKSGSTMLLLPLQAGPANEAGTSEPSIKAKPQTPPDRWIESALEVNVNPKE